MVSIGSRICVKSLPKYVAEDRLRDVFSQKGEVTDAKLMRTNDGKSRQFAFIGFRNQEEAVEAIKYFNNSYIDTCRITCEIAHRIGDPNIPRTWSRYSLNKKEKSNGEGIGVINGKSFHHASTQEERKKVLNCSGNDDPKFQEFLQVMQPRSKSKLWANDSSRALPTEAHENQLKGEGIQKHTIFNAGTNEFDKKTCDPVNENAISDLEYFKSRIKGQWSDSESNGGDSDANDDRNDDQDVEEDAYSPKDHHGIKHAQKADLKKEYTGVVKDIHDEGIQKSCFDEYNGDINDSENLLFGQKDQKDGVPEAGRLFVRNLPYVATEDDLHLLFSKYGDVSQVHLIVDRETKQSKGFAIVHYAFPKDALRALAELDHSCFQGRLLHVMPAKENISTKKQENTDSCENHSSKTFKHQKDELRKASEASGNTKAWNNLFIRPDTVVENIARKHGISKSDLLLDRDDDSLAVRMAFGETQVIGETKAALANAGVNVEAIEHFVSRKTDAMKRSNHILLAKNLPYGSSESELAMMFGKFGSLDKIILPSTKALALIVFLEASEARRAFKCLSYKRYKDAPLYLEWAPDNILCPNPPTSKSDPKKSSIIVGKNDAKVLLEKSVDESSDVDHNADRVESRSLYVKNLNFKTSDESLREHFSKHMKDGKILSLRIKKHLKNEMNVSMGFGFLEFDSVETAADVCRDLQGTVLDGHALILQLCHAKKDENVVKNNEKNRSSTKLIVRNVAFEATDNDLRQLFSPFGQIKRLSLPKKFGKLKGFAFVEFVTKQEAHDALKALSSTHLYGRHLVIERANKDESLEELRARTAAQFPVQQNGFQKSTKKRKLSEVLDNGIQIDGC